MFNARSLVSDEACRRCREINGGCFSVCGQAFIYEKKLSRTERINRLSANPIKLILKLPAEIRDCVPAR